VKVTGLIIPGVYLIEPQVFGDERGGFFEAFNQKQFNEVIGRCVKFVQDNQSKSSRGVLRGLHFQDPKPQGKLVRVLQGEVFDVVVDIRKNSPTYCQWVAEVLSAENKKQLWIPEGLAHGFLVLSETAEFFYKTTDYYAPECEQCILWNDPDLNIKWPIRGQPKLSAKDQNGAPFYKTTSLLETN
jgi:dTDP-4-dehydrorhamnose 3,5-epimerase